MLRKSTLIGATIINWVLFVCSVILLLTSPHLTAPLVPTEVIAEPLFSYYRSLGKALIGMSVLLLFAALLNTVFLIKVNRSGIALRLTQETEKPKGRPLGIEEDEIEAREDELPFELSEQAKVLHRRKKI